MSAALYFSRLSLRPDAALEPLMNVLAPDASGAAMAMDHRLMWTLMPAAVRAAHESVTQGDPRSCFLWRKLDNGQYYMLGPAPVGESPLFKVETKPYAPHILPGDRFGFDLRVNATVDRKIGMKDGKAVRKRLDVTFDRLLAEEKAGADPKARAARRIPAAEAAAGDWLGARAENGGFRLLARHLTAYRTEALPRDRATRAATIGVLDLEGVVEVERPDAFLAMVRTGLGHAKAFGCGLMLLRRIPRP